MIERTLRSIVDRDGGTGSVGTSSTVDGIVVPVDPAGTNT